MDACLSRSEVEAVVRNRQSEGLPDDCDRAMRLLAKMSDSPLSHEELDEAAMHMADCPACAMVSAELHAMRTGALEKAGREKASAEGMVESEEN